MQVHRFKNFTSMARRKERIGRTLAQSAGSKTI